uniref:Uncharacterized protein n=1 Tax=Vespula pensylvanica TaxID=30213 RepID=A0A834NGF9_VESPE|nr:hypothetical protein H0235_014067 [Vespula pensylvanica]
MRQIVRDLDALLLPLSFSRGTDGTDCGSSGGGDDVGRGSSGGGGGGGGGDGGGGDGGDDSGGSGGGWKLCREKYLMVLTID